MQQHGGDPEKALLAALSGNTMHSNKENMGNNFGGGKPRDGGFKKDRSYGDDGYNKGRSDFREGGYGGGAGNRREPREFGREFNGDNQGYNQDRDMGHKFRTNYNGFNDEESRTQPSSSYNKPQDEEGQIVFFCNLSFKLDEQDLMVFLKQKGFDPMRAKLLYHADGKSKGQGFVQMTCSDEASAVINELNNQMFCERPLRASFATNQNMG